jgi:predicted RND superfamily exporter protein
MLMARGAIISMLSVIFILPALLMLCDKLICATTAGMGKHHPTDHHTQRAEKVFSSH